MYLVGWSRSGSIASVVARMRPDLVKGLIIYEPVLSELLEAGDNPDPPTDAEAPDFTLVSELVENNELNSAVKIFFEQALEREPGEFWTEPTMLQRVVLDNARTLPLNFSQHAPDQPYVDCDFIRQLKVPGLILYGEKTNAPWQYMSKRYADCLAKGKAFAVKGANHDGPFSQPQRVADYIEAFISEAAPDDNAVSKSD